VSRGWLIVFAKAPRAGQVKTRLCPPLSSAEACEFYRAMLADILEATLEFAQALDLLPVLAFSPSDAEVAFKELSPDGFRLQKQQGRDLSERMANAFAEAETAGAERILLRGSDSPALDFAHHQAVIDALDTGDDLVLTPDQGGGYTLIGMRRSCPAIFDFPMSTESVLEQSLAAARSLGLRSSLTPPSFDVDTVGDFQFFDDLALAPSVGLCPRTIQALLTLPGCSVL
jgi:rSAM/selenodomain-associated transferase 1